MDKWFVLFIAGGAGTLARYIVSGACYQMMGTGFPYGTFVVNITGCFLAGFLAALAEGKFAMTAQVKLFLMAGFLGAFTTFSAFIFETANLIKMGQTLTALGNVLLSVIVGFLLFRLGVFLGDVI